MMATQWWSACRDEQTGLVDMQRNLKWRDATFSQECWNKKEDIVEAKVKAMDWRQFIGVYHRGEAGEEGAQQGLDDEKEAAQPEGAAAYGVRNQHI